jgi:hypothetical protein
MELKSLLSRLKMKVRNLHNLSSNYNFRESLDGDGVRQRQKREKTQAAQPDENINSVCSQPNQTHSTHFALGTFFRARLQFISCLCFGAELSATLLASAVLSYLISHLARTVIHSRQFITLINYFNKDRLGPQVKFN